MKGILRLPVLFLFFFVLLFLLFGALSLLSLWGSAYSEGRDAALRLVGWRFPDTLVSTLPVAVLAALLWLLLRLAVRPVGRLPSLLVPLFGAFLLLALGYPLLQGLRRQSPVARPAPSRYLLSGMFNRVESKVVYIDTLEQGRIESVVLRDGVEPDWNLLYFPQGRVEATDRTVSLRMAGYTLEADAAPVYAGLFSEDPPLAGLFADFRFLNRELGRSYQLSLSAFYLTAVALVLSVNGAGLFFRLTRWPLLNAGIGLAVARGILALFRLLREGVAARFTKVLATPQTSDLLPELVLLLLGALLFLVDLLFLAAGRPERG